MRTIFLVAFSFVSSSSFSMPEHSCRAVISVIESQITVVDSKLLLPSGLYIEGMDRVKTGSIQLNTFESINLIQKTGSGLKDSSKPSQEILALAREAQASDREFCFSNGYIEALGMEIGKYVENAYIGDPFPRK